MLGFSIPMNVIRPAQAIQSIPVCDLSVLPAGSNPLTTINGVRFTNEKKANSYQLAIRPVFLLNQYF